MINDKEAIIKLEKLLEDKQNNATIKNVSEEILFLCGGVAMIHELTKHNNKNEDKSIMISRELSSIHIAESC